MRKVRTPVERKWTMRVVWANGQVQWIGFQDRAWIDRAICQCWAHWDEWVGFVLGPQTIQPLSVTEQEFNAAYAIGRNGYRKEEREWTRMLSWRSCAG